MADNKYCSYHLTKQECEKNKNDGCLWLENGHTPLWGDSIGKQICVNNNEYKRKSSVFTSKDEWNEYVKKIELQKETPNIAGNIQNAKQKAQDKLTAEILSRGKQIKDNLIETNDKVRKTGQEAQDKLKEILKENNVDVRKAKKEAQDKFKGILSRGKQIEDTLKRTNVESNDEVQKAKQEAQNKFKGILSRGQEAQDKLKAEILSRGKQIKDNLYSTTKQHYLNLKSTY